MDTETARIAEELKSSLGAKVTTSASVLAQHGRDESAYPPHPPEVVVTPESVADVQEVMRLCDRFEIPVIPFGAGTSLEGHIHAVTGGVCIDMTAMKRVLRVSADDLDCTVEPGVSRLELEKVLARDGLFFPTDPGADATIGGMAATRASGTNAVRYGTIRDLVLSMKVVLPDGSLISTGGRARKSSAGYDLTRLFIGSEGTLGVIVELTLRLFGIPETIAAAVCRFPTVDTAVATVIAAVQLGIPMARIELLDTSAIEAVNAHSGIEAEVTPTLFLEFHGSPAGVEDQALRLAELADENGGAGLEWATDLSERNRLWRARHQAYYAALAMRPGSKAYSSDVCVPISALADCIHAAAADLEKSSLPSMVFGHVGDGNFHTLVLVDPDDPDEMEEIKALTGRLVERALAVGGTCTGEHGIGTGKIGYLETELGPAIDVMRQVKAAIDPKNIMNPGKIFTL